MLVLSSVMETAAVHVSDHAMVTCLILFSLPLVQLSVHSAPGIILLCPWEHSELNGSILFLEVTEINK